MTALPRSEIEDALSLRIEAPAILLIFLALYGASKTETRARCHDLARLRNEWRTIPGFTSYEASSTGDVRRRAHRKGAYSGRVLATKNHQGYKFLSIFPDGGKQKTVGVHRLVALAFHGTPPEDKPCACHKDSNRKNNRADNLYWGSYLDNSADLRRRRLVENPWTDRETGTEMTLSQVKRANKDMMLQRLEKLAQ